MIEPKILTCQAIGKTDSINQGIYIVISDALNTPPHIGMLFNGAYASLTNKGFESGISLPAFQKKMIIIQSPCIFTQVIPHPIFSVNYLSELFISILQQLKKADGENCSCLTPLKIFFKEGYQLKLESIEFVFQLIPHLQIIGITEKNYSFLLPTENKSNHQYIFPTYGKTDIKNRINNYS